MGSQSALTAGYTDGLRPTERERAVLLRAMEKDNTAERRKFPRIMMEGKFSILIVVEYMGGSAGYFRVFPWDLSRGGLSFFHRAYIHPGTKCTINGQMTDDQPICLKADVVRCEHVAGTVHTVGLKFEMEIDPDIFLGEGAFAPPAASGGGGGAGATPSAPAVQPIVSPAPALSEAAPVQTGDPWWDTLANLCVEFNQVINARTSREEVSEKLMELMAAAQQPKP